MSQRCKPLGDIWEHEGQGVQEENPGGAGTVAVALILVAPLDGAFRFHSTSLLFSSLVYPPILHP